MTQVHDFNELNNWSQEEEIDTWWNDVYCRAFPDCSGIVRNKKYGRSQKLGIDTVIVFPNGHSIHIDEKLRRGKAYNDILLEHTSSDRSGTAGWIEKDLAVDYIAYGFLGSNFAYILPWPTLKLAWQRNKDRWKATYGDVVAQNKTYKTLSTPVPVRTLMLALNECMTIPSILEEKVEIET